MYVVTVQSKIEKTDAKTFYCDCDECLNDCIRINRGEDKVLIIGFIELFKTHD